MRMSWITMTALTALGVTIAAGAQEAEQPVPTVKAPPVFPMGAKLSGNCLAQFDLNAEGEPENIEIIQCTDNLFEWSATAAIRKFRFDKKDGGAKGLKQGLSYNLLSEFGQKLPVPDPVSPGIVPDEPAKIKSYSMTKKPRNSFKPDTPWCCFEYSISDNGTPFNVYSKKCSTEIDKEIFGTGFDIREWVYAAALKNDNAISTGGHKAMLFYHNEGQRVYRGSDTQYAKYCPAP